MKRLKKLSFKSLCIILSLMMVLLSFPVSVFAIEGTDANNTENNISRDIIELKEKRTKNAKYYRLQDGSYMIAQYNTAIHYLDNNNEWQDIDNTLSTNGNEITTHDAKIKFAKKISGNETLFALHNDNQKLTLSLNGAIKKTPGTITNNKSMLDEDATELQKVTELTKISASVKYKNILPETDLEYVIDGGTIKENIIVKEKQEQYSYSFTMSLNNLVANLTEKGEIHVTDPQNNSLVYIIPAPVMWDGNMNKSNAVHMELETHGNGKYTLTVIADSNWMNAEDRVFPVTIDPPIYTGEDYSNDILDMDLLTTSPDRNSPGDTSIYVSSTWRAYWKLLDLPSIPASAYITDAQFTMECFTSSAMNGYVAVYDVMTDWDSSLSWSKVIASNNPQGVPADTFTDFQEIYCYDIDGYGSYALNDYWGYYWNVTPIVKKWYSGQNYGMMFAPATDTNFSGTAQFYSNNHSTATERPQLCISYRDMKGTEDYWSYSSQSAGFAGTGSVNNATGNLVFSIPTLTSTDALMPFTPTLVYNSALAGSAYTQSNAQTPYSTSYTPLGFKLNIGETLMKKSYKDAEDATKYYFVLADSDGTEHYFLPATAPANITLTATQTYYEDEDGLLLYLIEDTSTGNCTITDSGKNIRTFSSMPGGWYLSSVADKNKNKITFGVDSNYRPISVNLMPGGRNAIKQLEIAYNGDGRIYMVWNPTSHEAVIFRYSSTVNGSTVTSGGSYLREVVRTHGATNVSNWLAFYNSNANLDISSIGVTVDAVAEYIYSAANNAEGNKAGLLLSATNELTTYQLVYGYEANKVTSITEVAGATSGEIGQALSLEYNATSTIIRTSGNDDQLNTADDLVTTYGFDNEGRTISCYTTDLERTQIFGASNGQYVGDENEKAKNNLKSSVQTAQQSSNYLLNGDFEQTASGYIPYWSSIGTTNGGYGINYAGQACATLSVSASTVTVSSISQTVSLSKGDYSLAMYINTHESQGVKVYLKAESLSNPAHSVVQEISTNEYYATVSYAFAGLNFSADPTTAGGKETFKISVVVEGSPSETEQVWVDNIMLSKTTGAAEYDLIDMGHFETTGYNPANYWEILDNEETPITVVDSGIDAFGDVMKIDINLDEYEFVQQTIVFADDSIKAEYDEGYYYESDPKLFTISGWGKGTSQGYAGTSLFGIRIKIKYYDGSTYGTSEWYDFDFDKGITEWQFLSGGFATNPNKGILESITVMVMYNNHPGVGYFDNISLVMDTSDTGVYDYNSKGYLSSYVSGYVTTWYGYDDNDNLIRTISTNRVIMDYEYDSNNRIKKEYYKKYTGSGYCSPNTVAESDITTISYNSYGYNSYGQLYYTWVYDGSDTSQQSVTFTEYNTTTGSHIFGTVKNEMDPLGNITRYFYDETNGRLMAVTYPEENGVCYEYDAIGNLTQVLPATLETTEILHEEYDEYYGYTWTWTEYLYDYNGNDSSASVTYKYDENTNRLNQIITESSTYSFIYDTFGNTDKISVGSYELVDYDYNANNGKLNTLSYGNGLKVKYLYDILDRITEIQYNIGENGAFETVYSYTYDSAGNIYSVTDHSSNEVTMYRYDSLGRFAKSYVYDADTYTNLYGKKVYYDEDSRISMVFHYLDYSCPAETYHGTTYSDSSYYSYWYNDSTGNLRQLNVSGDYISGTVKPTYDAFGRVDYKNIDFNVNNANAFYNYVNYEYVNDGDAWQSAWVSQMISEIRINSDTSVIATTTYNYTYDDNGNITQITDANGTIQYKYYYDALGQLTREDNRPKNYSYEYLYDDAGNITAKKRYAFTTGALGSVQYTCAYKYEDSAWGDLLTEFWGDDIEYDDIGNPIKIGYYDDTAEAWSYWYELTWEGRQLVSYQYFEDWGGDELYSEDILQFTYNADGIRTSKTAYGVEHKYYLDGSQITAETWMSGSTEYLLYFIYDENGSPIGLKYRTSAYAAGVYDCFFFEKNLQGDIVAIYNASGKKIGTYTYDAWGNVSSSTTSGTTLLERNIVYSYNPFRYRGYYYDTQTGWYYLQSRYYNPNMGRFLNADGLALLGANGDMNAYNLFAYCSNNPVMGVDYIGYFHLGGFLAGVGITVVGIALIAATAGAATPAVVALAGAVVGTATVSTGVTMMGAAATDSVMVIDASTSISGDGVKNGASLVLDFGESTYDVYAHGGYTVSKGGSPITYSTGIVFNYETVGDYGGPFVNVGGSYDWLGFDYCRSPDTNIDSVSAASITFGLPGTKGIGRYVGWDNYRQITSGSLG